MKNLIKKKTYCEKYFLIKVKQLKPCECGIPGEEVQKSSYNMPILYLIFNSECPKSFDDVQQRLLKILS